MKPAFDVNSIFIAMIENANILSKSLQFHKNRVVSWFGRNFSQLQVTASLRGWRIQSMHLRVEI